MRCCKKDFKDSFAAFEPASGEVQSTASPRPYSALQSSPGEPVLGSPRFPANKSPFDVSGRRVFGNHPDSVKYSLIWTQTPLVYDHPGVCFAESRIV